MGKLGTWLASLTPSIVGRVLAALGMGIVTIKGIDTAWDRLQAAIIDSFGKLPQDVLQLLGLSGFDVAMSWILGALAARLSLYVLTSSSKIIGLTK